MGTDAHPGEEMPIGRRLSMAAKAARAVAERDMAANGSNLSAAIIVRIVAREPGLSQRQLADRMHIQGPTVLRHLDRLEAEGLITRTRDERDRRVQRIDLTPAGRKARDRLSVVADAVSASLTQIFTPEELAAFEGYLDRISTRAHDLLAEEGS
ncbi:MAG: MarR family winged helix-turn-helix transcriptional regulator [Aquihabitans sp.]